VRALGAVCPSPLAEMAGLHFLRAALIRAEQRPAWWRRGASGAAPVYRDHLLVTAWVDGDVRRATGRLAEALAAPGPRGPFADELWGGCLGYPGAADVGALGRWLWAHRLRFSLYLDSRRGYTAEQVQAALALRAKVESACAAHEGDPVDDVCATLSSLLPAQG